MSWQVNLIQKSKEDFQKINPNGRKKILNYLTDNIAQGNPRRMGRAVKGKVFRFWKYNTGNYNIICQLKDKEIVVLSIVERSKKSS